MFFYNYNYHKENKILVIMGTKIYKYIFMFLLFYNASLTLFG